MNRSFGDFNFIFLEINKILINLMDYHNTYLAIKAIHIISVISWLAALLYLPRIFSYHAQKNLSKETSEIFKIMEKKLAKIIMNPAMIISLTFGIALIYIVGFNQIWIHIKITILLFLFAFHGFLIKCCKNFANDKNKFSAKFFRLINEIPAVIMIIIVFIAIFKPFS